MREYRIVEHKKLEILWKDEWTKLTPYTQKVSYYQAQIKRVLSDIQDVFTWESIGHESTNKDLIKVQIEQYEYELANEPIYYLYIINNK